MITTDQSGAMNGVEGGVTEGVPAAEAAEATESTATGEGGGDDEDDDEGDEEGALPPGELSEDDQLRARAQTAAAQWFGNALRMVVESAAEMEFVLYLVTGRLTKIVDPRGGVIPPEVALVSDCARAVLARCWPTPPRATRERGQALALVAKFPLTLDAIFALAIVEVAMRYAGANCEALLALVGQPGGPPEAERGRIQSEHDRWMTLVTGYVEVVQATREASGVVAMGMSPAPEQVAAPVAALSPIEPPVPAAPTAPATAP